MMKLIQHLGAQRRAYNLSDVFVNDSVIGFSYMQRMMGTDALYDKSTGETMVFDRSKDDVLFGEQPSHRQIPTFCVRVIKVFSILLDPVICLR